jgi:hypothetical protein
MRCDVRGGFRPERGPYVGAPSARQVQRSTSTQLSRPGDNLLHENLAKAYYGNNIKSILPETNRTLCSTCVDLRTIAHRSPEDESFDILLSGDSSLVREGLHGRLDLPAQGTRRRRLSWSLDICTPSRLAQWSGRGDPRGHPLLRASGISVPAVRSHGKEGHRDNRTKHLP